MSESRIDLAENMMPSGEATELLPDLQLFAGDVEVGEGASFSPTLLIGLGGTGAEVLLRVKRMLRERGASGHLSRFVFIDADQRTFSKMPGLPPVERDEACLIGMNQAVRLLNNPELHPHVWSRFPKSELKEGYIRQLALGEGAGQIRAAGALALLLDYANVRTRVEAAYNSLVQLSSRLQAKMAEAHGAAVSSDVVIYVVGSLAGGTGSGCAMDVSLMARDICRAHYPRLVGVFALPDAFDEKVQNDATQKDRIRANCYAALKELQFVLDADADGRKDMVFDYGNGTTLTLPAGDKVFSLAYLIDNSNAAGGLSKIEDLYELMARTVYQDVGSRLGAHRRSFDRNCGVITGVDLCPKSGLPRPFSSAATSALVYPSLRVGLYCTYRTLHSVIQDTFLVDRLPAEKVGDLVNGFLARANLDDRGSNNQLIESLLTDPTRNEVTSAATHGLPLTWGANFNTGAFAAKIEATRQSFASVDLPKISHDIVNNNLQVRLGYASDPPSDPLRKAVEELAVTTATDHGVPTTLAVLQDLEEVCKAMKTELEAETTNWASVARQNTLQRFNERRSQLAGLKVWQRAAKTDQKLKRLLIEEFNYYVDQEAWALARPACIRILDTVIGRVRDVAGAWSALGGELREVDRELIAGARRLEAQGGRPMRDFVVEIEVTRPNYEIRYYQANAIKQTDALKLLHDRMGGARALYLGILGLKRAEITQRLGHVIHDHYAAPLSRVNLIEFVRDKANKGEVEEGLDTKLESLFEMCQPFWHAQPLMAGMSFPEFVAASVHPVLKEDNSLAWPPEMDKWIKKHGGDQGRKFSLIPSDVPYEIVLSRRTHGARAFYLAQAADWKKLHERQRETARGKYPLEIGAQFKDAPDLFPDDQGLRWMFTLGIAFGFIVVRGDYYYFNLEEGADGSLIALYEARGQVLDTLEGVGPLPAKVGVLNYRRGKGRPKASLLLGQGREKAFKGFVKDEHFQDLLNRAWREYHQDAGTAAVKAMLTEYVARVLTPESEGNTPLAVLITKEKQALERSLLALGA